MHDHHSDDHDDMGGLHRDLAATGAVMDRRGMLRLAARFGVGAGMCRCSAVAAALRPRRQPAAPARRQRRRAAERPAAPAARIPQETAGPYPGDGSNGPNVLSLSGRRPQRHPIELRRPHGVADGVPLTIALTIVSTSTCAPLAGRAVYLWHCDRAGRYSLYSAGATNQNYLRGVQEADVERQGHVHVDLPGLLRRPLAAHPLRGLSEPVGGDQRRRTRSATSQIALPKAASRSGLRDRRLREQRRNLAQVSLATDNVFSDGSALELATMTGSVGGGLTAALTIAV